MNPTATAPRPATPDGPAHDAAWRAVFERACAAYRPGTPHGSRWAWHWSRGKLGRDPAFRGLLARGDFLAPGLAPGAGLRVVDIGCGQGLVAQLLLAAHAASVERGDRHDNWPATWPRLPALQQYHGVELMAKDAHRGDAALAPARSAGQDLRIVCADMCEAALPACDVVVILDVLHYVPHAAQDGVLARVRAALQPGGRLLLRVGDMAQQRGFAISQWVDWAAATFRGHRAPPTWGRTVDAWCEALRGLGFQEPTRVPLSQGTPFANVLLVADLPPAAAPLNA